MNWRDQLDELAASVRRWTGNNAGIAEVSEGELPRLRKDRPPVVQEVSDDAVDLAGESADPSKSMSLLATTLISPSGSAKRALQNASA